MREWLRGFDLQRNVVRVHCAHFEQVGTHAVLFEMQFANVWAAYFRVECRQCYPWEENSSRQCDSVLGERDRSHIALLEFEKRDVLCWNHGYCVLRVTASVESNLGTLHVHLSDDTSRLRWIGLKRQKRYARRRKRASTASRVIPAMDDFLARSCIAIAHSYLHL